VNELELFGGEKDFPEKTMTIKELSETLGVSRDLVEKRVKELLPNKMSKGKTTILNRKECNYVTDRISGELFKSSEFSFGIQVIENLFSRYKIIKQFPVFNGKYKIDFYIPLLKVAIEYDERYHNNIIEYDETRETEIKKELGCIFLRYKEGYTPIFKEAINE